MARSQDPDSAGCQFFICLGDARFLDRNYTAFGRVLRGDDVLGVIGETPVAARGGEASKPTTRVNVDRIEIVASNSPQP
jgi:peptidyl-prolyl cis-trans isomerase B (cyclophilin B)